MSIPPIITQISAQLASARCEQDLDNELSTISEADWLLFIDHLSSQIKELKETEPERAQSLHYLMHSYLEGWQRKKYRELSCN
ncbi:hypothetical protein [Xanthocytophaga agilis]|uniref:Uncharacterized protein n=1 Tax=Xanthocytophaga agilis TaxID=3048010 RepID=A0AAE3UE16_9BACT|nr:hypothetical protein [Xanthocytophaga agilis]MDJ1501795.1 hypothetical protein [Xanthocytophaga agilis]